ncbi:MAG: serine hydrolase [Kofleriaceae bacterium]|nr:serine hydrolase [Kofleriaceae bacterium]MCB9574428.1 serine hydrolase [Kofleriaceae bacterium]
MHRSLLRPSLLILAGALALAGVAACGDDGGAAADLDDGWVVTSPEAEGMDPQVLDGARAYAFADGKNTQGVVVVRHGRIAAEWYWDHADASSYAASWSMAKSVTSATIGIALDRGLIPSLDVPVADYLPSWQGTDHAAITLRSVLTMTSGLDWLESYAISEFNDSDVIAMVVTEGSQLEVVEGQPVAYPPGEHFNYSSGDAMLLSAVLEGATGMTAGEFAQQALFAPLGIETADWWRDATGNTLTYCCLDMRSRDFARFGQLYLDGGERDGTRVVSADWVAASTAPSPAYAGYGYMWWRLGATDPALPADTYAAIGHDGQWTYVIPSLDLVVVRNGYYFKSPGDSIAVPNLFDRYPSEGLVQDAGTTPPDSWDDAAFLGPIIQSIQP